MADSEHIQSNVRDSIKFIRKRTVERPRLAIILGSGLGEFANTLENATVIPTSAIPHYPKSTVPGHGGKLVFGRLGSIKVLAFQGRVHFYETGDIETILYPIRVAWVLGIRTLIVTNAAGGIGSELRPGDLMVITDQINLSFERPYTIGSERARGKALYDESLRKTIEGVAEDRRIAIAKGVYCGVKGPSYETAAEIRMARHIGADAVGMSTVNEVSLASRLGMRVAGISCITNLSTGISDQKLSHHEVTEVANLVKHSFTSLLEGVIREIGKK
ncbi:MAG TPA: purine-nucleoside phosphorylase [Bacteroidota bacterium]|nr:purine-nucleoside phosphorylase [Bacteroidota bacterium]